MYLDKSILGLIPARAGSKGLPGKNLRILHGKPMIGWTIEAGRKSRYLDRLVLTSEDPKIIEVARSFGCEVPFVRPNHLATDSARAMDVVIDALDRVGRGYEYLVLLQPTSPLRLAEDIDRCIERCIDEEAPAVVTVAHLVKPASFHGVMNADGVFAHGPPLDSTPSATPCMLNGAVYVARTNFLRTHRTFTGPGTVAQLMPFERSLDVDSLLDFLICELILSYFLAGRAGELHTVRPETTTLSNPRHHGGRIEAITECPSHREAAPSHAVEPNARTGS